MNLNRITGYVLKSRAALVGTSRRQYVLNPYYSLIGNREIVGNGFNSLTIYRDSVSFPFPAVRFKESTADIIALREKERGDWRNLTVEEKRALYRASFCHTFAEMQAPTGRWKSVVGFGLMWISFGVWLFLGMRWLCPVELPDSFTEKSRNAQLKRMLALEVNPITGLASRWDYKKEAWKN